MADKNGREVGRVSLRVLPNMDNFRRQVEQQVGHQKPVKVDVQGDTKSLEKSLAQGTRKRSVAVDIVPHAKKFVQGIKDLTHNVKPEVKVDVVHKNFRLPDIPELQMYINENKVMKQMDKLNKYFYETQAKWQVKTPSLGVTGAAPKIKMPASNRLFDDLYDFRAPLQIIHDIHKMIGSQVKARMLDDLHKGLDTATTKMGNARDAFRDIYATKFKPRYVDPFTEPFRKGAANARGYINDVRREFNEGVADMRKDLKNGFDTQRLKVQTAIQAPKDRKELNARKPDLSGYKKELEVLQKILKARQLQSVIANKRGQKTSGYTKPLAEVQKLLDLTKNLSDTDIIGRKAVQKALSDIKKIDKGIVGLNTKMITGAIPDAPSVKKGKKQKLSPEIDLGSLRTFEKEYTTAFQRIGRKARGELNMIHNAMGRLNDGARSLTQRVVSPVKSKAGVQVNKIKDVWDSSTAKKYRMAWSRVAQDTKKSLSTNLQKGMGAGSKAFRAVINDTDNLDKSVGKLRRKIDGVRATKDIFGVGELRKSLGFAEKDMNRFSGGMSRGFKRIALIGTAVAALIAPAMGLIGGALASLPALGLAGAATIAVVALGMEGIKEAAQAAAPEFNNLKNSISDIYADGLVSQFEQLGGVIAQTQPAMENVARASMVAGQGFTDAVSSARGVELMNKGLNNTAGLFESIQPFTQGLTMGLLELAAAGTESFDGLSDSLNSFGEDFEENMRKMSESGAIQDIINSTFTVLGSLGSNLGAIMGAAMAELPGMEGPLVAMVDGLGSGLVSLMPLLASFSNFAATTLGSIFTEIGNIGASITPGVQDALGGLTGLFTGAVTGISSVAQSIAPVFNGLMAGLSPALSSIGGSLIAAGQGFAVGFTPHAEAASGIFESIAGTLGGALASGLETLAGIMPMVGDTLGQVIESAGPGFEALAEAIAPLIEGNFETLVGILQGFLVMLPAIAEGLGLIAGAIATVLSHPLTQTILGWVQAVVQFLAPLLGMGAAFLMLFSWVMKGVAVFKMLMSTLNVARIAFQLLMLVIKANPWIALITVIIMAVGALINFFRNTERGRELWAKFTSFLASAWETAKSAVVSGIDAIKQWFSDTVQTLQDSWNTFTTVLTTVFDIAKQAVIDKFNEIKNQAQQVIENVKSFFTNIDLSGSGRAMVQGFINGIRGMIEAAGNAARAVVDKVRGFFPNSPAKEGPFSGRGWVLYSGRAVSKGFAQGMLDEKSSVAKAAKAVTDAAAKQFNGNIGATIEEAHRAPIREAALKANAEKIAKAREQETEAEKKAAERIAEIQKSKSKAADKEKKIAKVRADLAKKNAERDRDLLKDLEAPDYSQINRSFDEYWVGGVKQLLKNTMMDAVDNFGLIEKTRASVKGAVAVARREFGNHPIFDQVLKNVDSDVFEWAVKNALEESGIAEVPVTIVASNLDQFKSDLGMGDGVISRAIDAGTAYDIGNNDAKRYREAQEKTEVHYHVEDMNEAIRLEKLRERKQMMKIK